jgi:hypothetical protein
MVAVGNRASRRQTFDQVPVIAGAAEEDVLTQWSVKSKGVIHRPKGVKVTDPLTAGYALPTLEAVVRRPALFLFFFFAVALSPALLGATYLWGWFNVRRGRRLDQPSALELGAALLALLAIRQVLATRHPRNHAPRPPAGDTAGTDRVRDVLGPYPVAFAAAPECRACHATAEPVGGGSHR